MNTEYATFARSVGSDPDGVFRDTGMIPGGSASVPSYRYVNEGACLDWDQCHKLGLNATGFEYFYSWRVWVPGSWSWRAPISLRWVTVSGEAASPYAERCMGQAGFWWYEGRFVVMDCDSGRTVTSGIRPVFKLKPGLELRMENGAYELD